MALDVSGEAALQFQPLGRGFDDPVRARDEGELFETARVDEAEGVRYEQGWGIGVDEEGAGLAGPLTGEIEEGDRHPGVGQMRGNPGTHRAGADDRRGPDPLTQARPPGRVYREPVPGPAAWTSHGFFARSGPLRGAGEPGVV